MGMTADNATLDTANLHTIRDLLRLGVTEFTRARLVFGHGTSTALDEAAFMILTALDLPPDELAPWLDCRLTNGEKSKIADLFAARIATRKPASYLLNTAYIQGHRFYVDERVIVPRSYIGELMADGFSGLIDDPAEVTTILDMCTGSGCLAILAALIFATAKVDAVDLSSDALAVAHRNIADYHLTDRVAVYAGDLFAALANGTRYDLIIANPPYVARAEVQAFDPEYAAEPAMAHLGGDDGLDIIHRIMAAAPARLSNRGLLILELGTGRDRFEIAYPDLDVTWLDTASSTGEVLAVTAKALQDHGDRKSLVGRPSPLRRKPAKRATT
ncbi:MAG: 50S ribosomal protein L3 N(5)-glutamine methyltransferase [Hyphomicrobiaceae bacterium]|nr:50S ribosomal protein L3 N(5)-glutamine methyltransferase [Hyphomicrobiaceae bacterium]